MDNALAHRLQTEYRTQDQEFAFFVGSMGLSVQEAQRRAGISSNKAWELMRDDTVLAYIEELRAEHSRELVITKDDATRGILRAITQAHTQGDPKAQIGGWAEINKMHGFHAPQKQEVDHNINGQIEVTHKAIREAPTEELERIVAEGGGENIEDAEIIREMPWHGHEGKSTAPPTAKTSGASGKSGGQGRKTSSGPRRRASKQSDAGAAG